MNSIRFFIKYCWENNKKYIIYTFLFQLLISIIPLLAVILPKFIIDELLGRERIPYLIAYVAILLGYQLVGGYLANTLKKRAFIQKSLLFITFQSELTKRMANADFEKIESAEFLDQKEKASKFLYGNGQGFGAVFDNFASILGSCFVFAGIVGIIATLNGYMLIIFILLSISTSYFDHQSKKKYVAWDMEKVPIERKTNYLINVIESFQYAKEIRIFNLSSWLTAKVDKHLSESNEFYTKQVNESVKVENINLLSSFFRDTVAYLFLIAQFFLGEVTMGEFTMYLTSINTFSALLKQVLENIATIRQYQEYFEALKAYMRIPQIQEVQSESRVKITPPYQLVFENVSFKYPGSKNYALREINFVVHPGDKVAIVGENGSGKTTLIKLLCRLYRPTSGRILLNGVDVQEIGFQEYTRLIASVFQDFKLFSFSIKDNLVFENTNNIPDESLTTTLKNSGFHLDKYEKGLETSIYKNFDEAGFEPSGGEGQKIALARAELKQASFILLDEPTAAMDPKAEMELYYRFKELTKNKTTFFISHRLASTKFCDYIFCLSEGRIVEVGSHQELRKNNNFYEKMYRMQSELYS